MQPLLIRAARPDGVSAYATAGEVTGLTLRKTGKQLTTFGENVLKHLWAEEDETKGNRIREKEVLNCWSIFLFSMCIPLCTLSE